MASHPGRRKNRNPRNIEIVVRLCRNTCVRDWPWFSILAAEDERPVAQSPSEESPSKFGEKPDVTPNAKGFYGLAVIRVYDDAGNVIETHQHKGDFKDP